MEPDTIVWTFALSWVYGLVFGIEHLTADDDVSWMIAIHLGPLRITIEKIEVTPDPSE